MFISMTSLIIAGGLTLISLVYLLTRLQKENDAYVSEVKFYLRQRILAHNKIKAKYSILQNRMIRVEKENQELRQKMESLSSVDMASAFDVSLQNKSIIEEKDQRIEKLELEISSIEKSINGDIKDSLTRYMQEVDGLSKRLETAKGEFSARLEKQSQTSTGNKNIA